MITINHLFFIFLGYLSGSVLYAYLLPKYIKKIDVTKESADGNPGATPFNMEGFFWAAPHWFWNF